MKSFRLALLPLLAPMVCGAASTGTPPAHAPVNLPAFRHGADGQIFYFALTDRFANGDTSNDRGGIPGDVNAHGFDLTDKGRFHGGDFKGLIQKLDYIKSLGVTTIWITPPFRNNVNQANSSGYHGYWILDFLHVDPHLGTDQDFRDLVTAIHAKGMRVFLDIVANHTGDVIKYRDGSTNYVDTTTFPFKEKKGGLYSSSGFTLLNFSWNGFKHGLGDFPALSADNSFPHVPYVPEGLEHAKQPEWLNNPLNYHNRGDSTFKGESSVFGDFSGLDDLFTEKREVVEGFIDIYRHWIKEYQIDGYRIDTVRHVNKEFWQAFCPAIKETGAAEKRAGFFQFGEYAMNDAKTIGDFLWETSMDSALDFPFFYTVRDWVSKGAEKASLEAVFRDGDDQLVRHDGDAKMLETFVGNHDDGRIGFALARDNPGATDETLLKMDLLAHGLLLFSRGQPVVYYGDEQGMKAIGNDMMAREDMFASQTTDYKNLGLIGTKRTGADDKFDTSHPLYKAIQEMNRVRLATPALLRGSTTVLKTGNKHLLAVTRFDRTEKRETLLAFNNSAKKAAQEKLTLAGAEAGAWELLYASPGAAVALSVRGNDAVSVTLPPLGFAVWQARSAPASGNEPLEISLKGPKSWNETLFQSHTVDGQTYPDRWELAAKVTGGSGHAEVTFALERASRQGEYQLLGVDDSAPYRVYWHPPVDIRPNEHYRLIATVRDQNGQRATATIEDLWVDQYHAFFGISGSQSPHFTQRPQAVSVRPGEDVELTSRAEGPGPLEYQWYHDGEPVAGANEATYKVTAASAGNYVVQVRNRSGTTYLEPVSVTVK